MYRTSQLHFHPSFIFIEMNFHSLSFLCDIDNMLIRHDNTRLLMYIKALKISFLCMLSYLWVFIYHSMKKVIIISKYFNLGLIMMNQR